MSDLPARHYLWIYQTRLAMAEEGITHPTKAVVVGMKQLVNGLSALPPEAKVRVQADAGRARFETADTGNLIAEFRFADTEPRAGK